MTTASPFVCRPVARLWPGETVCLLGSGPSLTQADVDACRGARVMAIKDTHRLAPWADALYSADERWWAHYGADLRFTGHRFALVSPEDRHIVAVERANAHRLAIGGKDGLALDPSKLTTGQHSGYSAINLAVHLGAKRIVLLGYDMQKASDGREHYFGSHPYQKKQMPFQWLGVYETLVEPLLVLGVTVINATRETALTVFPKRSLAEALA